MTAPLVWLPFDPADLGTPPAGLRYETVDPRQPPASVGEVALYVPPYEFGSVGFDLLSQMSGLQVVQMLTAGVDAVLPLVPGGVTLCSGRGIHDASTAELALTLVLAGLRGIPEFVRDQARRTWRPQWRPALADKRVLIVGFGAIGEAVEARLTPFEVTIDRVARRARDGVHAIDDLPALLPEADVVILILPLTDSTRGLVDADFLARMRDGALLVNVARGAVVHNDALLAELATGRITAAVDVVDPEPLPSSSPLWDAPGLLISPHTGGTSSAMWPRAHRLVREQLERFAAGEPLLNVVER